MPTPEMESAYRTARERYEVAAEELRIQLVTIALVSLSEVLPGAASIDVVGEFDEDWIPTLRIQRVRSTDGQVLFDVDSGHPDPVVEDTVDVVDIEYLDRLIDLTGERYMGAKTIDSSDSEPSS